MDDGPAFQRAIDSLPPGGSLFLAKPPKQYAIATGIIISKPISVSGDGWDTIIRANSNSMTAVFEVRAGGDATKFSNFRIEGSKSTAGGTPQRGIYFNGAQEGLVQRVLFSGPSRGTGLNFGVDINANSGRTRVIANRMERMVSSSGNGTAVLVEASRGNEILNNVVDGREFHSADGAAGAAIFLTAEIGGIGSVDNVVANNIIHDHPQAAISINSTTYFEFKGDLGACDRNVIADNEISHSISINGGDASSGIVIAGNSSCNRIIGNRVHHNGHSTAGGFGIVIAGSQKGEPREGHPKKDETPNANEIRGNRVFNNQDDGIAIKGAINTSILNNFVSDNSQRAPGGFNNISVTHIARTPDGSNTIISDNNLMGGRVAYQIGIGTGVPHTRLTHNFCVAGVKGVVNDQGVSTIDEGQATMLNNIPD